MTKKKKNEKKYSINITDNNSSIDSIIQKRKKNEKFFSINIIKKNSSNEIINKKKNQKNYSINITVNNFDNSENFQNRIDNENNFNIKKNVFFNKNFICDKKIYFFQDFFSIDKSIFYLNDLKFNNMNCSKKLRKMCKILLKEILTNFSVGKDFLLIFWKIFRKNMNIQIKEIKNFSFFLKSIVLMKLYENKIGMVFYLLNLKNFNHSFLLKNLLFKLYHCLNIQYFKKSKKNFF